MTQRSDVSNSAAEARLKTSRQMKMDMLVGYILQYGVLASLVLVTIGLCWKWAETGKLWLDYRIAGMNLFQFVESEIRIAASGEVRPRLFVNLGIAVLMLTPFIRVAASVVYFMAVSKNWKYTLFTLFVLIVLTHSLFLRH